MNTTTRKSGALAFLPALALAALLASTPMSARAQAPSIGENDLGGVVTGPSGPEAGVWVIAETKDLPTKFAKIVVTDDQGRYVIPDLPKGSYTVWVRGIGLVDSDKQTTTPGKQLNLTAKVAPNEAAAARYYPGMYWYSMLEIPGKDQFPGTGTGAGGNGIPTFMKSQDFWVDTVKNACQSCHALGSEGIRHPSKELGDWKTSADMWMRRIQSGQAQAQMATAIGRLGPQKGLELFGAWTDSIQKGALPTSKPSRPQGVERNVVITSWDWMTPKTYGHDLISTDKRNPRVNANGLVYGSPEESTDHIPTLDPVRHIASNITAPYKDPRTPTNKTEPLGTSVYWGDEPIWDSRTSVHNPIMDEKGRVWFTSRIRPAENPAYCKAGSDHPSAKVLPIAGAGRHLTMYDPKTQKWNMIDTCFGTHHLYFGYDSNNTLWTSAGGPAAIAIGWLNTKMYDETGDDVKSQAWSPLVLDTNGDGKRSPYAQANEPIDPAKDKRMIAGFYGVQPSPKDNSIWGQAMDVGFSRMEQPGYIIRFEPGADPTNTGLGEVYLPPTGFGSRGIDVDTNGVAWTVLASGHMASFDRTKCKGPLNGPAAVTGKHCPEGWTLYKFPGPGMKGVTDENSAEHAYYIWVDRFNTLGLGNDVPIAMANGSESLLALVGGKFVSLRVPYPLGFFTKNADGRIDDPNAGWKGKGLWTTSGSRTTFHSETGKGEQPKVFKLQMRPDPLAR